MSLSNGYANGHTNGVALLEPATSGVVTTQDGGTLTHDQWLAECEKDFGIGASDLAIVAGVKGSISKFWYQKKGVVPKDDVQGEQAWWGTKLEPIIAERFEQLTGEPLVSQQIFLRHPEHPWLYCTLDRLTLTGEIVELKCLSNFGNDREDGFGWDPDNPPAKWIIQAQQQLAITGEDHVRFAVFYVPSCRSRSAALNATRICGPNCFCSPRRSASHCMTTFRRLTSSRMMRACSPRSTEARPTGPSSC